MTLYLHGVLVFNLAVELARPAYWRESATLMVWYFFHTFPNTEQVSKTTHTRKELKDKKQTTNEG